MRLIDCADVERAELLRLLSKKSFDEVQLSDRVREANKKIFGADLSAVEIVRRIVNAVRERGDEAIIEYTRLIDRVELSVENILVSEDEFAGAEKTVEPNIKSSLERAAANIRRFHEEQMPRSWITYREPGSILGQTVVPIERAGIYVPGGTAAYPSSVLMNAIPARVAGVSEIIMCVPSKGGAVNPNVLVAAKLAGVDRIYKIGGAQAIAAMAFGTATIPRVDKITGPGNIFVTLAKKEVYGHCDIDMLAGPSEILIIADESADPICAAADMLSQAEHDPLSCSIVITTDARLSKAIAVEVDAQLKELPRREIAQAAIERNGLIISARSIDEAVELANVSAPEHLELLVREPFTVLPKIKNAGAVFLGGYSPEPLGDYFAGPNHVLPTGGTARYFSVLNVETFLRRMSLISYSKAALLESADDIIRLAQAEGLDAHANAIRHRQ
ncbi:MAG: histidinol dehydrogenase [Selenomonadaceae bacterium]|nr:histidinol dehydrogenase [Selenomonadaceae bacterium]